jgi:hypothetical protein
MTTVAAFSLFMLAQSTVHATTRDAGSVPALPEDCGALYKAAGNDREFAKALACYRAEGDWMMVAIMQVNGEGTPVDLPGARASIDRVESQDKDVEAMLKIIAKREGNPNLNLNLNLKGRRIEFCKDVAMTTASWNSCQAESEATKTAKKDSQLKQLRTGLDPRVRPAFDRAQAAFERFVKAEADRVYQEYIDGSIRNQEAMDQEARARRNLMASIKALATGTPERLVLRRPFADADKELNVVYNDNVSSYIKSNLESAASGDESHDATRAAEHRTCINDYKTKARAAQHEWVRYRDAMGDLAAARWPEVRDARERARALVTEDRIRELRAD